MGEVCLKTVGAQLSENARLFPEQDSLVFPDTCRYSWARLNAEVDRVASGMISSDVKSGMHIALWSPNRAEWVLTFLAAARIGAVVVSLDPSLQAPELKLLLFHSDAEMLFMAPGVKSDEYIDIIDELLPQRDEKEHGPLASTDFPKLSVIVLFGTERQGFTSFDRFIAQGANLPSGQLTGISSRVSINDLVNIQYTSAAFGTPKGVMLSQKAILENGAIAGTNLGFSSSDRLCLPLPFFHAFGCSLGLMLCLTHAATLVALERFTPEAALKAVSDEQCTAMHGVPTMFLAQLESDEFTQHDLTSLRTGIMAGAPCPVELMVDVINKMNARDITIAYGQTEAGPLITQTPADEPPEKRVATVGQPLSGVEVKIADPVTGDDAPVETEGELCARSPMLMHGYYKMPEETSRSIDRQGWLRTGDLAIMDSSGFYRITGRLRNMIIRGGQNIYPVEIESCLLQHPGVNQIQVYGVADRTMGEIVAAKVVLESGQEVNTEALQAFCNGKIAHYKVPSSFEFVSSL